MDENNDEYVVRAKEAEGDIITQTTVAVLDKEKVIDLTIQEYTDLDIQGMIYEIRGQQVMLDADLALLYDYEVKRLNEQVKRNIERFPEDFMFRLTMQEYETILKSQKATSSYGGRRKCPYAFTEQGIYMLPSILKGKTAEKQSVLIIRTFRKMRHYLVENKQLFGSAEILKITHSLIEDNIKIKEEISNNYRESKKDIGDVKKDIESIKKSMTTKDDMQNTINKILDSFIPKENLKQFVFKDGQPFEANEAYINIYKEAKHSIYIVDDYINCHTLSLLSAKQDNVNVIIFCDNKGRGSNRLNELEFNNFNVEYPTLSMKKNNGKCHDRFIVLDYKYETEKIYHYGASSKDAGRKVCCISLFSTSHIIHLIIDALLKNNNYIFS
ncbi:MAG: ORF6N domain-containing protein [Coprobacillus sp.]